MNLHLDGAFWSAWVDGELSAPELASAGRHLAGCAECRALTDRLRAGKRLVAELPRETMPPDLRQRLHSPKQAWAPRWKRPALWWALAAAAAASLTLLFRSPEEEIPSEILLAAHTRYAAESLVPVVDGNDYANYVPDSAAN